MTEKVKRRIVRNYTPLGERIAALAVKGNGAPQRQIALALGVSQQTVSKKLRGETAIMVSDLEKLAGAFNVSMDYWFPLIFAGPFAPVCNLDRVAMEKVKASPKHREAMVVLADLSPQDADRARQIMRTLGGRNDAGRDMKP